MAANCVEKDFGEQLAAVEAMLRLVTASHPFQPVLAASIDPCAWKAIFVDQCKTLHAKSLESADNDQLQQACQELSDFAKTIYAAAHFARFESYRHPESDPVDFEPDDEFFENDERWLRAAAAVQSSRRALTEQLGAIDERRKKACDYLRTVLFESPVGPNTSLPAAFIAAGGGRISPDALRDWLTPPPPGLNADATERMRRERRIHLDVLISSLGHEQLIQVASQVHPGVAARKNLSSAMRSARQSLVKKLRNALRDVRASAHLEGGWQNLRDFLTASHVFFSLIARIHQLITPEAPRRNSELQSGSVILDSLCRLTPEVLDPRVYDAWRNQLKAADQLQAAVLSLELIRQGYSAVGKNTLAERIKADSATSSGTGWIDKADERLHTLGVPLIAIHGSENWLHQMAPSTASHRIPRPKRGRGWLINPLIILCPEVCR